MIPGLPNLKEELARLQVAYDHAKPLVAGDAWKQGRLELLDRVVELCASYQASSSGGDHAVFLLGQMREAIRQQSEPTLVVRQYEDIERRAAALIKSEAIRAETAKRLSTPS